MLSGAVQIAPAELDGSRDQFAQHAQIQRLGNKIECAELQRAHGGLDIAVRGNYGDRGFRVPLLYVRDQIQSIAVRQSHIGETEGVALRGKQRPGTRQVAGRGGREIHACESEGHQLDQVRLVIDDQYNGCWSHLLNILACNHYEYRSCQRFGSANTILNMLPPPSRGS